MRHGNKQRSGKQSRLKSNTARKSFSMTVVQINGKLPWKCFRSKTGSWIAVCDLLKVAIEADTWALLMQDIGESVNTIFKDLFESDQLDHFLRVQEWQSAGSCRPVRDIYTSTFRLCQASSTPKHTIVRDYVR